jgi:hypothetical protein
MIGERGRGRQVERKREEKRREEKRREERRAKCKKEKAENKMQGTKRGYSYWPNRSGWLYL